MAGNSERRGAKRNPGSKKGQTVGSGGQRRKQLKILDLFGQIDYDPDYDYKEQRKRE